MLCDAAFQICIIYSKRFNTKHILYITAMASLFALVSSLTWLLTRLAGVGAGVVSPQHLIVIDTDPGIDDASAILTTLGDSSVNVLAITCVRGNTDVPNSVINALKILSVAKKMQIPVFSGSNSGLVDSPALSDWFGLDGLGDLPFIDPPSPSSAQEEHAASFLARIVKTHPGMVTVIAIGPLTNLALALHLNPRFLQQVRRIVVLGGSIRGMVTVIAIGPLTNLALALHLNPRFLQQVRRIVVLGGSIRGNGNVSPGVEFNFHMDPSAANIVLNRASEAGTLITIVPLESVYDNDLNKEWRWEELAKIDNAVVSFLNKLERKNLEMHPSPTYTPFDTYAATVGLYPESVIHSQKLFGGVEHEGQRLKGALMVDYMNTTQNVANLEVILEINATMIKQKMIENLSSFK